MKHAVTHSAILFLLIAPLSLEAQVIRGRVLDAELTQGISAATVTLLSEDSSVVRRTATNARGAFLLHSFEPGNYRISATSLGYGTTVSDVYDLTPQDTILLEIRLSPDPVELPGVVAIVGGSGRGRNRFYQRMAYGEGLFIDPDRLAQLEMHHPADAFKGLENAGVRVRWRETALGLDTYARALMPDIVSSTGHGCFHFLLNGQSAVRRSVDPEIQIANLNPWVYWPLNSVLPQDLAGIEVYRDPSEVPQELLNYAYKEFFDADGNFVYEISCGVVVIWTKDGW